MQPVLHKAEWFAWFAQMFYGGLKIMIVRKSWHNHFLTEGVLSNAVHRSYPFILSPLCALIGRGFLQTLLKPLPLLLDEDAIEARLRMKRPFSAQAYEQMRLTGESHRKNNSEGTHDSCLVMHTSLHNKPLDNERPHRRYHTLSTVHNI